jgi:tetratricopeptide (TPR) repeat protein
VEAITLLQQGLDLCLTRDLPSLFPTVASRLGTAYTLGGRFSEGVSLLERVEAQARTSGKVGEGSLLPIWLGEAYLRSGRLEEAIQLAERALRESVDQKKPGLRAWAFRFMGHIAQESESPDVESPDRHYRTALSLAQELGMRPLVAHSHLSLGKLYRRTGKREQAQDHLTTATTMYREMGMRLWLEQAEAEIGLGADA